MAIFHQIYKCASVGQNIIHSLWGQFYYYLLVPASQTTPVDEPEGPISVITGKPNKDGIKLG